MNYLAPLALFGSRTALEEGRIQDHVNSYKSLLEAFVAAKVDLKKASKVEKLNHYVDEMMSRG